jgi:hypothetical protein
MPDYRLPFSNARQQGLIPDLAPIRVDMRKAVINLYAELIADNPLMPFGDESPTCRDSELNETQRALFGVYQMIDVTPPWPPQLLPRMIWAARLVGIGKTRDYIEQRIRMSGNDPDMLAAAYADDPDRPGPDRRQWRSRFWRDPYTYAQYEWWTSIHHPEHLEFNQRVFEFALRRLPDLIALDEEG